MIGSMFASATANAMGNDAFQEVDTVGIVRNVSKYAVTVRDRKDLGRILKEAFYIARTGRPGPVVVDIPKNIQKAMGSDVYPDEVNIRGYKPNTWFDRRLGFCFDGDREIKEVTYRNYPESDIR